MAGRSNGLGPVLAGNTILPVINSPPLRSDNIERTIWSSLDVPSGIISNVLVIIGLSLVVGGGGGREMVKTVNIYIYVYRTWLYNSRASRRCCARGGANPCDAQSLGLGSFAS